MYSCISEQSELTSQQLCTHVYQINPNLQVSSDILMYLRAVRTYKSAVVYSCISEQSKLTSQQLCTLVYQSIHNLQVSSHVIMYLRAVITYMSAVKHSCISCIVMYSESSQSSKVLMYLRAVITYKQQLYTHVSQSSHNLQVSSDILMYQRIQKLQVSSCVLMYLRVRTTSVVMYSCISEHSELTSQQLCTHVSLSIHNLQVSSYVLMYLRAFITYKSSYVLTSQSVVMYSCISEHSYRSAVMYSLSQSIHNLQVSIYVACIEHSERTSQWLCTHVSQSSHRTYKSAVIHSHSCISEKSKLTSQQLCTHVSQSIQVNLRAFSQQ